MTMNQVMKLTVLFRNGSRKQLKRGVADLTVKPIAMGTSTSSRSALAIVAPPADNLGASTGTTKGMQITVSTDASNMEDAAKEKSPRAFFTITGKSVAHGTRPTKIMPIAYGCSKGMIFVSK